MISEKEREEKMISNAIDELIREKEKEKERLHKKVLFNYAKTNDTLEVCFDENDHLMLDTLELNLNAIFASYPEKQIKSNLGILYVTLATNRTRFEQIGKITNIETDTFCNYTFEEFLRDIAFELALKEARKIYGN